MHYVNKKKLNSGRTRQDFYELLWQDYYYDELLQMNNEITIHQKHLHALICEVFKSSNNSNSEFMWSYLTLENINHNIRNAPMLKLPDANLRITALIPSILGHAYCRMVFPSLINIVNPSLHWKGNWWNY